MNKTKIQELKERMEKLAAEHDSVMHELHELERLEKGVPNYTDDDVRDNGVGWIKGKLLSGDLLDQDDLNKINSRLEKLEKLPDMFSVIERLEAVEDKLSCKLVDVSPPVASRPAWIREDGTTDWGLVPSDTKMLVKLQSDGQWYRRYFSIYCKDSGRIFFYVDGKTQWSSEGETTFTQASRVKLA